MQVDVKTPDWLNPKSLKTQCDLVDYEQSFTSMMSLTNLCWIETCAEEIISWVLDVLIDSFIDDLDEQQKLKNFVNTLQVYNLRQQSLTTGTRIHYLQQIGSPLRYLARMLNSILQTILQDRNCGINF